MRRIIDLALAHRRSVLFAVDAALLAFAYLLAFALAVNGAVSHQQLMAVRLSIPWVVAVQMTFYVAFRLYQGVWRYVSLWDAVWIASAIILASAVWVPFTSWVLGISGLPRPFYAVDPLLAIGLLCAARATRRIVHEVGTIENPTRILIIGAGDAGEMIVRDMNGNPYYGYEPIGFVDDDAAKVGRRIRGVPVLGCRKDLARIVAQHEPQEFLIAMPRLEPGEMRAVLDSLKVFPLPIKTLPNLSDWLDGRVSMADVRDVSLEDLLGRTPVGPASELVREAIAGRSVMVTGAGGSIGSELCRQILSLGPARLLMLDHCENGLYAIENELRARGVGDADLISVIGDVKDFWRVDSVLGGYEVDTVFHAAAHKHVPLMELNPCEAIKNNVGGTRVLAEAAARNRVKRLVLVSTDKAVNPSNVMGASKRVAELVIQTLARETGLGFASVRFGNVLGSNGSVIPRFIEQIQAGGPVTVTHPEMRRFFMLIPEAVHLVLQAAATAEPGATYVLEMGEQIRIVDMARHLIQLAGYVPDEDIRIEFTGTRPGEKFYEELLGDDEVVHQSPVSKVMTVRQRAPMEAQWLRARIARLEAAARAGDEDAVFDQLRSIIPTFKMVGTESAQAAELAASAEAENRPGQADTFAPAPILASRYLPGPLFRRIHVVPKPARRPVADSRANALEVGVDVRKPEKV